MGFGSMDLKIRHCVCFDECFNVNKLKFEACGTTFQTLALFIKIHHGEKNVLWYDWSSVQKFQEQQWSKLTKIRRMKDTFFPFLFLFVRMVFWSFFWQSFFGTTRSSTLCWKVFFQKQLQKHMCFFLSKITHRNYEMADIWLF